MLPEILASVNSTIPNPDTDLIHNEDLMDDDDHLQILTHGFLPAAPPLKKLPHPYYAPWETLIADLPSLLTNQTFRTQVDALSILSTHLLLTPPEHRRAYLILCFLAHGYIWGGTEASKVLPPQLTVPLLSVSSTLSLPPVATYAALNLWNWSPIQIRPACNLDITTPGYFNLDLNLDLESIQILHTFTATADEAWFYAVSIAMEALGAKLISPSLEALAAASRGDYHSATSGLWTLAQGIAELALLVERMDERCDPTVFYTRIRPFLAGSRNMECAGLSPCGVFYDEGNGKGEWRALRGGSNGQSSLIQFLDVVLGVMHTTAGFHQEVRGYMPPGHRGFLERAEGRFLGGMRGVLMRGGKVGEKGRAECEAAFREATEAMAAFRGKHLQMVTRYIIIPSRQVGGGREGVVNLATASSGKGVGVSELTGTGGTALLPFLKETRDNTLRAGVMA